MTLKDVKAGDFVVKYEYYALYGMVPTKVRVDNVDKKSITISNYKFCIITGLSINKHNKYDFKPYIKPLSEETERDIVEYQQKQEKESLVDKIQNAELKDLSLETLQTIVGMIEGEK